MNNSITLFMFICGQPCQKVPVNKNKCKINVNGLIFRTKQVLSQRQSETEKTNYIQYIKHTVREEVSHQV